jgi:hypothetical protein
MVIMAVVIFFNVNIRMLTITVNLHMARVVVVTMAAPTAAATPPAFPLHH